MAILCCVETGDERVDSRSCWTFRSMLMAWTHYLLLVAQGVFLWMRWSGETWIDSWDLYYVWMPLMAMSTVLLATSIYEFFAEVTARVNPPQMNNAQCCPGTVCARNCNCAGFDFSTLATAVGTGIGLAFLLLSIEAFRVDWAQVHKTTYTGLSILGYLIMAISIATSNRFVQYNEKTTGAGRPMMPRGGEAM